MTTAKIWNTFFSTRFKHKDRGKENEAYPAISYTFRDVDVCLPHHSLSKFLTVCTTVHPKAHCPWGNGFDLFMLTWQSLSKIKSRPTTYCLGKEQWCAVAQIMPFLCVSRKPEWSISNYQTYCRSPFTWSQWSNAELYQLTAIILPPCSLSLPIPCKATPEELWAELFGQRSPPHTLQHLLLHATKRHVSRCKSEISLHSLSSPDHF